MIYGRKSIIHGITFCFSIVLILFLTSCEKGLSIKEAVEEFSLEDAKVFHLEHAADLRLPNGGNNVKSTIDYEEILVPQWDNATYHEVQFPSKLAKTYEIPLNTGTIVGGVLLKEKGDSYERATMKSSLVIQEFSQREKKTLRQMVVTVIGNDSNGNVNSEAFTYMGSHNTLTGFMVVSTLEGKIVNIFQYINGIRSRVYVKHSEDTADNAPLYGFSFLKAHGTKSSYGNSEPGICYMCGKEGMVYIQYGNICESCLEGSELLDGIIVTPNQGYCEKCGRLQDECVCNPFACNVCGQEPCICDGPGSACGYCDILGCNGECRGDGDGGGDGEDGNENDDNNIFKDEKSRKEVGPVLDSLMQDCAGRSILNNLGNEIGFQYDSFVPMAVYNVTQKVIKWGMLTDENTPVNILVILEELIHAIQYKNKNAYKTGDNANWMNIEVEAKIGIYLYAKHNNKLDDLPGMTTDAWVSNMERYLVNPTPENYSELVEFVRSSSPIYADTTTFVDNRLYRNTINIDALFNCYNNN